MATLPSGLPEVIAGDDDIARFLTQSGHYNSLMAKPAAFLPNPQYRNTSVSRHGSDPDHQLWMLGRQAAGNRNLHGAAIFKAQTVASARLEIVADEPPDRHAVIRGWTWVDNDPELQKSQQLSAAQILASQSTLVRHKG